MKPIQTGDAVGDYRVIEIAGAGGMGAVYKIEHTITKRVEAMKLLPPGFNSDGDQQRFEREIQVQARLHHPNIVELYNAVRIGDSVALVMEFVEGESLQHMMEGGPLPAETAVDFTCQVLRALAYAHEAGVIHRDVAPANIIITPERSAKLTDFGLARGVTDLRLSTSGVPMGSPWYMSPEQVRGIGGVDARTDLYAIGAVLHEMLTGGKLFDVEGAFAVMRAHVEAAPALPSSRNPKVPAALDEIVGKAVAKDPALRFQSAEEFRLALQDAVAGGSAMAEPAEALQIALPPPARRLPRLRLSRGAAMMALMPATLAAGFYAMRYFPAVRMQTTARSPLVADLSRREASVPAPVEARVEPQAPVIIPAAPPAVPPATENSPRKARRSGRSSEKAMPRAATAAPKYEIRVTGGEPPMAAVASPSPAYQPPAPVPEPLVLKTDAVEAAEGAGGSLAGGTASELEMASPEAAPVKPPNGGNRFVRALGKINPFRKGTKRDPAEVVKSAK